MKYPKNRAKRGHGMSVAERQAKYRAKYSKRDKHDFHLKWRFGIGIDTYEEMFAVQGGRCAICGQTEETALSVDHDHVTGNIRDLLCRKCNAALGAFGDTVEALERALAYLKRNN